MREMQRVVAGFLAVALLILPTTAVAAVNGEGLQSGGGEGSGTSSSLEDGYGRDTPLGETAVPTTDGESPEPEVVGEQSDLDAPAFGSTITEQIIVIAQENPGITADEIAEALGFGADGGLTLVQEDGLLSATVVFQSAPTPDQVDALEAIARVRRVLTIEPIVMVLVAPLQLDTLRTMPGVASVDVNLAPQSAYMERELSEAEAEELLQEVGQLQAEASSMVGRVGGSQTPAHCRTVPAVANAPLRVSQARQS